MVKTAMIPIKPYSCKQWISCEGTDEMRHFTWKKMPSVRMMNPCLLIHGYSSWLTLDVDRLPVAAEYEETAEIVKIYHKYRVPMGKLPVFFYWSLVVIE